MADIPASTNGHQDSQTEAREVREILENMDIHVQKDSGAGPNAGPSARQFIYLLSLNWFNLWKVKVHYESDTDFVTNEATSNGTNKLLPRINDDLIDHEYLLSNLESLVISKKPEFDIINHPIKQGLQEDEDFMYCKRELWEYFANKYPVTPLV